MLAADHDARVVPAHSFKFAAALQAAQAGDAPILIRIETRAGHGAGKPTAKLHVSRRSFYRIKKKLFRPIDHGEGEVLIHRSVKQRWDRDRKYRPQNLVEYVDRVGWSGAQLVS